jgi:capsular exopolysaccharide synthesis family protein
VSVQPSDLPNEELRFDPLAALRAVRKYRWVALSVFVAFVSLVLIWTIGQPRIYEASASVDIEQTAPQILGNSVQDVVTLTPGNYWFSKEYYETQYRIISSRAVGQRVVDKLGLAQDIDFLGLNRIRDEAERRKALQEGDPVAVLQSRIHVVPVKDTYLAEIRIQDTDPKRAALLANAVAQAYVDENGEKWRDATLDAEDDLRAREQDLKSKVETSEVALYDFKRDNDILSMSLEDQQNTVSQKLRTLSDEITKTQTKRIQQAAQLKQLRALQAQGRETKDFSEDAFGPVLQSPLVQTLKQAYFTQKNKVAELAVRYQDQHPKLIEAQGQLAETRLQLQREIEHITAATEAEYQATLDSEAQLSQLLEGVRKQAFEVNKKEISYRRLDRESQNDQKLYELVLKRLKETDLAVRLKTNNVHLQDTAVVPVAPARPNLKANLLFALALGLLGGFGAAFLLDKLDNTLKTQEQIERALGLSFLGVLPSIAQSGVGAQASETVSRSRDLYVFTHPKSSVAECCRSIRTNLLFMSPDQPLRRILVTSSGPREGKTTTAISLGVVMAQSGNRVLLVDSDMRRPRLHRAFGVANEVGLSTAIVGEAPLETCIKSTEVPGLSLLPCGPIPPNPAEMLHAERFKEILANLSQRFDLVIFDSPPVAAVADGAVLSTLVDGTLLVVKAGKTTHEMARRAVDALSSLNANIVGAILNDLDLDSREYGYYHYYQRGYYADEPEKQAAG